MGFARVLLQFMSWSNRHAEHVKTQETLLRKIQLDPDAVAKAVKANL